LVIESDEISHWFIYSCI